MTATLDGGQDLARAGAVGSRTGIAVAIATGAALSIFQTNSPGLLAAIAFSTVGVALFARTAGRIAGQKIAAHGLPATLGIGALAGAASLLVAALMAALSGFIWSLHDRYRDAGWLWSYLGKPFVAVLAYGSIVAPLVGIIAALVIRGILGRRGG